MADVISQGRRHVLVQDGGQYRIFRRTVFGDKHIASFPNTDDGRSQANIVFEAISPGNRSQPTTGSQFHRRRTWPRVAGLIGAIAVLALVVTVAAVSVEIRPVQTASATSDSITVAITVAITDTTGTPIPGANVSISGTQDRGTTDAAGQVQLAQIPKGIYQVVASLPGYYEATGQLSVARSVPAPILISMTYEPPTGSFLYSTGTNQYDVLQITGVSPFAGTLVKYSYGCILGWTQTNDYGVVLNAQNDTLTTPSGGTTWATIIAPGILNPGWTASPMPTAVPPNQC